MGSDTMSQSNPVGGTIGEAYRFAVRAFAPSAPYLIAFALSTTAVVIVPMLGLPFMLSLLAFGLALFASFLTGCVYSAKLYGIALRTGPDFPDRDDIFNLSMANAAIYLCFGILGGLLSLIVFLLSGILAAQVSGLDGETAEANPDAIGRAFAELFAGPGGAVVALIALACAGLLGYMAVRLLLFGIATFARGEIRVFSTWGWTRDNVKALAPIALFTHIAPFIAFAYAVYWIAVALGGGPAAIALWTFLATLAASIFILPGHGMATRVYLEIAPNLVEAPKPHPGYREV